MSRLLPLMISIPLVLLVGALEGVWTDRWGRSTELQSAVARLENVPLDLGEWKGKNLDLDADQVAGAQLSGYLYRQYVHKPTGNTVSILLVCGRPGPISVHTPDVCYRGAGFEAAAAPLKQRIPADSPEDQGEFWTARFQKPEAFTPALLRIS